MKSGDGTPQKPYKQSFYEIVVKNHRRADICLQSSGSWIFFITNLVTMVYHGSEYVQPCLYGRKDPKAAIFGGMRHYNMALPYNPIVKRVFLAWRKENPRDEKYRIGADKILHYYPAKYDGIKGLVADWPTEEKQRRIEAAEEAAHYQALLESGYFDDMENEDNGDYEDFYYPDDF